MGKRNKQGKAFATIDGVTVTEHKVGNQLRYTVPADGFEALVALWANGSMVWIRSDFLG